VGWKVGWKIPRVSPTQPLSSLCPQSVAKGKDFAIQYATTFACKRTEGGYRGEEMMMASADMEQKMKCNACSDEGFARVIALLRSC